MCPGNDLLDLSLERFADRVAERTPTPGGGCVAAHLAALGAALATMAFRFTSGERYSRVEGAMAGRVEALLDLRRRAEALVDRDSAAYGAVTAAFGLPRGTEAESAGRAAAIQSGLRGALEVPLETLRVAREALRLTCEGAPQVNPNLASDCATGVWCLRGAAEAASLNVRINAASLKDRTYAEERLAECERILLESRNLAETARTAAEGHLA